MEVFKDIPGYEGIYQASSLGRIKSLSRTVFNRGAYPMITKERFLKQELGRDEYLKVILYNNGKTKSFKVHQLIAMAFLNHKPNGRLIVVNHKDFNKLNNNCDNLEVVTQIENTIHRCLNTKTSSQYTGVLWNKSNNKWKAQIGIGQKRKHLGYFTDELEASNAYQEALKTITF